LVIGDPYSNPIAWEVVEDEGKDKSGVEELACKPLLSYKYTKPINEYDLLAYE
jgi:hypothetical protein